MRTLVQFGIAMVLATAIAERALADVGPTPNVSVLGASPTKGLLDPETGEELGWSKVWLPSGWFGWLLCLVLGVVIFLRTRAVLRKYRDYVRATGRVGFGKGRDRRREAVLFDRVLWWAGLGGTLVALVALFTGWWVTLLPGADEFWLMRFLVLIHLLFWIGFAHKELISDATSWRRGTFWGRWLLFVGLGVCPLALALDGQHLGENSWKRHVAEEAERIGAALLRDGQYDAAMRHYDRAFEHSTNPAKFHSRRADVWQGLGEYERTISDRRMAIQLEPNVAVHLCRLADSYRHFGRRAEAVTNYCDCARRMESDGVFRGSEWLTFWDDWFRTGDFSLVIDVSDRLIQTRPPGDPNPGLFSIRAVALHSLGRYQQAKDDYMAAVAGYRAVGDSVQSKRAQASEHSNLIWLFATCPDASIYSPEAAISLAAEADQLLNAARLAWQPPPDAVPGLAQRETGAWLSEQARLGVAISAAKLASGDLPGARERLRQAKSLLDQAGRMHSRGLDYDLFWKRRAAHLADAIDDGKPYREREPIPLPRVVK